MANSTPSIGRIVHFVLAEPQQQLKHRPAIITQVWGNGLVNLQVFTDQANDGEQGTVWKTSVPNDETGKQPYSWHWCEYVQEAS